MFVVKEQENTVDKVGDQEKFQVDNKKDKPFEVVFSHAVVNPEAMVIVALDTGSANIAMHRPFGFLANTN